MYSGVGVALTAAKTVEREQAERERERGTEKITTGRERERCVQVGGCHSQLFRPHTPRNTPSPFPWNERRSNSSHSVIKGRDRCLIAEVEPIFFTLSIAHTLFLRVPDNFYKTLVNFIWPEPVRKIIRVDRFFSFFSPLPPFRFPFF